MRQRLPAYEGKTMSLTAFTHEGMLRKPRHDLLEIYLSYPLD